MAIDLDGDTVPDLATAGFASVSVLLGNGDGTLGEPVSYPIDGAPVALAVSDLDGDTVLDVVATSFSGDELNVLLGNGDGTLQARSPSRQEPTGTVSPTSWPSRNSRAPMPRPL
ncbi:MAG: VCBS repeat-containing protein [Myxococcota bacterium]|nr:VCBS repeat-containing protein [Myxococcota bacterium]